MNLIKCENGHFYDSDKFLSCPHCANQIAETEDRNISCANQNRIDTETPDSQNREYNEKMILGKTVGWLVCIEGAVPGESFILREGENCIGRTANMDIALLYEPTVSREKHAIITYDSLQNHCILHSPAHADRTHCNGRSLTSARILRDRDIITLGDCSLLFVPLCNSSFHWPSQEIESKS